MTLGPDPPLPGQGPRPLRVDDDRLLLVASDRLSGLRRRHGRADPRQGPGADRADATTGCAPFEGHGRLGAGHLRPRRDRRRGAGLRRRARLARPGDAGAARRDADPRVHRARAPGRPGLRRVRRARHGPRRARARRACASPTPSSGRASAPRPRRSPATTATSAAPRRPAWSARRSWTRPRAICLALFALGAAAMAGAGLVLADTKFELGWVDGGLVVCDEVMTPDSSRDLARRRGRRGRDAAGLRQAALPRLARRAALGPHAAAAARARRRHRGDGRALPSSATSA